MGLRRLFGIAAIASTALLTLGALFIVESRSASAVVPAPEDVAEFVNTEVDYPSFAKVTTYVKTYSVVSLHNDRLDACIDFIVRVEAPPGLGREFVPEPPLDLQKKLAKLGTEIDVPCVEQFATIPVLASCVATTQRSEQTLQLVERYYDYTTVGVDEARMDECLRLGGEWYAIAKNSPEYLHAKRASIVQDLEAMVQGS